MSTIVENCLFCCENVKDGKQSLDGNTVEANTMLSKINVTSLCEILKLSKRSFSLQEEYGSFESYICFECDSNIKRIKCLLEELRNIENNLSTLRRSIHTQLKESLKDSNEFPLGEAESNNTTFDKIRLQVFNDLSRVYSVGPVSNATQIKQEPEPYDSDYEGDSIADLEDIESVVSVKSNIVHSHDLSTKNSGNIKEELSGASLNFQEGSKKPAPKKLNIRKRISVLKAKQKRNYKPMPLSIRKKIFEAKLTEVKATDETANEVEGVATNVPESVISVSRAGRVRRATIRPDFLYKSSIHIKKSIYEESESEEELLASNFVKVETAPDPLWDPGNLENPDESGPSDNDDNIEFDDQQGSESCETESENNDDTVCEDVNDSDYEHRKPAKLSPSHRTKKVRIPKNNGNLIVQKGYKHIIDPTLTELQIKLIGRDGKALESEKAQKIVVNEHGEKTIDLSSIVKDESIAAVSFNNRLYGKRPHCTFEGCKKSFPDVYTRDIHVKRIHEGCKIPYECEHCKQGFKTPKSLRKHQETKCLMMMSEGGLLPRTSSPSRRKQVRLKTHQCEFCPERWRSPSELQIHIRKAHTGETPFKCEYCELSFISAMKREYHTEQHHDEVAPIKCEYCAKGFFREHRLKTHVVVHTGERPFLCEICCKSFALKAQLNYHQIIHDQQSQDKFRCQQCQKSFASPQNLKQHVKSVHEKIYKYICEICNHKSAQMSTHRVHMRNHTGEKPFKCTWCGKAYICGSMLKIHLRNHTGEKPYECDICGKAFTVKSKLTRHQLLHKEERPFVCTICGKGFTTNSYLSQHYKTSHKDLLVL